MTGTADRLGNTTLQDHVIKTYHCLLADICELSRVPLGTPDDITYDWVLKEAPKLDKELLMFIEGGGKVPSFPEWLSPLLDAFLSSMDGKILGYIRQLLLFCYKIEHEPSNEQLQEAQQAFEETDSSIGVWDSHFNMGTLRHAPLFTTARQIVGKVIYRINWSDITPSHGPGAVYPPRLPRDKSNFSVIYKTINEFYPYAEYFCALPGFWDDVVVKGDGSLTEQDDITCRLVAVPKDSRGPRLICVHPSEAIWIQQGLRRNLERAIESPRSATYRRINFTDQSVNGDLALKSSIDQEYCTLDLKEASDRISCELVRYLFGDFAYSRLSSCRASKVRLLDDRVIQLRKWAPMGNCLTFPVQSLIFYSLVQAGIRTRYGTYCNDIYVFGDDILFPCKFYDAAVSSLVRAGLVPNAQKTFRRGFFRESCGVDAYRGIDVTPHRLRRIDTSTYSGAMSVCTLAKAMAMDGYRRTSESLYRIVQRSFGELPLGNNPDAQGLYRYEDCKLDTLLRYGKVRFNRALHKWQSRVFLVSGVSDVPNKHAWWHVQDSILRLHLKDNGALETGRPGYAVPHRTRLKRGWADIL